jgi:DNA-binding response OmpR family regulator
MDELTARLEALLRRYAAAFDQPQDDRLGEQFRRDLQLLVAEYGPQPVSPALDEIPDMPSGLLH